MADNTQFQLMSSPSVPRRPLNLEQQEQVNVIPPMAGLTGVAHTEVSKDVALPKQLSAQRQTKAADVAATAPPVAAWTCPTCTFEHKNEQAGFLACAVCGTVRFS